MKDNFLSKSEVVSILREEYSSWAANLSDEERHAIRKYTLNSNENSRLPFFYRMNAMLRGQYNQPDSAMLARYADIISMTLRRQPAEHSFICYRRTRRNYVEGLSVGTVFKAMQFTSTSVVEKRALRRKIANI